MAGSNNGADDKDEDDDSTNGGRGKGDRRMKKGRAVCWRCEAGRKEERRSSGRKREMDEMELESGPRLCWWRIGEGRVGGAGGSKTTGGARVDRGRGTVVARKGERIAGHRD